MDKNERQGKDETGKNIEIFLCFANVVVVGDAANVVVVGGKKKKEEVRGKIVLSPVSGFIKGKMGTSHPKI